MRKKGIYSKENLESFVYDLFKYLYSTRDYEKERLSENVLIYSMNKCFYVSEKDYTKKVNNIPIKIDESRKVEEDLDYYNKDTLTICMDSRLCEYLYYYDIPGCKEVSEKVNNIFLEHGFILDFGASYIAIAIDPNKCSIK